MTQQLVRRVEEFVQAKGISPGRFGRIVMGDHRFYARLLRGSGIHHATLEKVARFIDANANAEFGPELRCAYGKNSAYIAGPPIAESNRIMDANTKAGSQALYKAILREHPHIVRNLTERRLRAA